MPRTLRTAAALLLVLLAAPFAGADKAPLELADLMRLRTIQDPAISDDGAWVAYALVPDRGDGELVVQSTDGRVEHRVERGADPVISADGAWVAARVEPTLEEKEKAAAAKRTKDKGAKAKKGEEPRAGLALLATAGGAVTRIDRVESFAFSADGRWLAYRRFRAEKEEDAAGGEGTVTETAGEPAGEPGEEPPEGVPLPEIPPAEAPPGEEPPPAESPETAAEPGPATEEPASAEAATTPPEGVPVAEVPPPVEPPPGEPPAGEPPPVEPPTEEPPAEEEGDAAEIPEEELGSTLVLRRLQSGEEVEIAHVTDYAFAPDDPYLAYAVSAPDGEGNGLYLRALGERTADERALDGRTDEATRKAPAGGGEAAPARALHRREKGRYGAPAWAEEAPRLAFTAWTGEDHRRWEPAPAVLFAWDGTGDAAEPRRVAGTEEAPEGWYLPGDNELSWTRDGARLFFGFKPLDERREKEEDGGEEEGGEEDAAQEEDSFDPYDLEAILEGREVDVWHGDDPLIVPHQKQRWKRESKRVYTAVYHTGTGAVVPLADRTVREIRHHQSPRAVLGLADVPYLKEITWDDRYVDLYRVDLRDGSRQLVAERLTDESSFSLSPEGRYVAYYRSPHWYLFDGDSGETRNLTGDLPVPFADEDHDYPQAPPGYGVADWEEGDRAVLVYDKFDLWRFPAAGGEAVAITAGEGRRRLLRLRLLDLDPERDFVRPDEELLLLAYHDRDKSWGFWRAGAGGREPEPLLEAEKKFTFVAKAAEAPRLLYTRESYSEFPDLWVAGLDLAGGRRLSRANPQLDRFALGEAELVEWKGADGEPLQGVLIKPAGYREGERYPVIVYFYRLFSPRLYDFNQPAINHRPSFPLYAGRGYALFLPDIRFEVGRPGLSAVKALVSGVQKLVEMGVADPERIGLHGHSWSGYQTAYVITQTDLFAAAVAGAPVSNMTSAYSGIRWGSGLARQFQYEQGQSRLGGSLWEARDRYIENSPVFYADRIETPLLIQFGDADGAVPWYQGIELYLALRRLGKEVVFLQYRGEDHHLEKYANKLDYTIKMLEFFDHHLQGAPAPAWMTEGVPYRGE